MNGLHDFIQTASGFYQNPPAWIDTVLVYTIVILTVYSLYNYYLRK